MDGLLVFHFTRHKKPQRHNYFDYFEYRAYISKLEGYAEKRFSKKTNLCFDFATLNTQLKPDESAVICDVGCWVFK